MPTFAGIPLLQANPQLTAWVEHNVSLKDVVEFRPAPRLARLNVATPYADQMQRPIKLGTLWWPSGASRWAIGHFLATESQLAAIRAIGGPGQSLLLSGAFMLVMSDGLTSISPPMFMLPPRPLAQNPPDVAHWSAWTLPTPDFGTLGEPVYLLTLVDERYFWWDRILAKDRILVQEYGTTWLELFNDIAMGLGIALTVDTIAPAYLKPPGALSTYQEYLPLLLDLAAASVGQRVVRSLTGVVATQNPVTAQASMAAQIAANTTTRTAGGLFAFETAVAISGQPASSIGSLSFAGAAGLNSQYIPLL